MCIPFLITVLAAIAGARAAPAPPLTSAAQVKRLSLDEARAGIPVALKGVVTQVIPEWGGFSMQDGSEGIYVSAGYPLSPDIVSGAQVEVQGSAGPGNFAPVIVARRVRVTGPGHWPRPEPVAWQQLATGTCDNRYVEVQGVVRAASVVKPPAWEWKALTLRLDLGGNLIWAYLRSSADGAPDGLVDSTVRVRGVCLVFSNSQRRFQGVSLFVTRPSDIRVVRPGSKDPFAIPAQPIARVFGFRPGAVSFHRVKLEGVATLIAPTGVYIQQSGEGVFVRTGSAPPVLPGDRVEAVGFPSAGAYSTVLDDALVRAARHGNSPWPLEIQARAVLARVENAPVSPDALLLRVKGRLVDRSKSAGSETLVLQDGATVFTARLSAPAGVERLPGFAEPGSMLAVTGVCAVVAGERGLPRSFELLMRSGDDLALLASAPWLTEGLAVRGAAILLVAMLAAAVWLALLRRRVARQTETIRTQLRREAALEERFRDLVENAGDLVFVRGLDGALLQVNHGLEELTGYPKPDLLRMNLLDLLVPEERDRTRRELQAQSEGGTAEWTFLSRDGRALVIETKQRFLVEDGRPVRVECIGRDVTWRKRASDELERRVEERTAELTKAAESLRATEERFRLAVEAFPSVFIIYDCERRIQFMNQRGAQFVGTSQQAVAGRRDEELLPPSVTGRYLPALRRCAETRTAQYVECDLDLPAGKFHMIVNYVPVTTETGELAHILGIAHDMTERKRLEEQLQHSQRLDSIGKLAGGVAHDFNNLLTVIGGYAQMLSSEELSAAFREPVEQIARAADRAASLTRQLLIFSRRQASAPVVVGMNEVVRNFEKMLRRVIPEDIEFTLALDPEAGSICADPGHIEQVLMNLIVNARDAMPGGGKLGVETAPFHVDERFAGEHFELRIGDYVLLKISDTGAGMPPEVKERIFEPFFTTKEQGKGTGLGLSMVYGIVKQCGGEILVYSEPGLGSTFRLFFPRTEAVAAAKPVAAAPAQAAATGEETVLVVEDEPGIRKFICDVLRRRGYAVLDAANGREALETLAQHPGGVDLLLTDIVMPEMGGHDLARRFLELYPGTPVLEISGYNERWSRRGDGAEQMEKPFTASALLAKVREVLEGARSREPGARR